MPSIATRSRRSMSSSTRKVGPRNVAKPAMFEAASAHFPFCLTRRCVVVRDNDVQSSFCAPSRRISHSFLNLLVYLSRLFELVFGAGFDRLLGSSNSGHCSQSQPYLLSRDCEPHNNSNGLLRLIRFSDRPSFCQRTRRKVGSGRTGTSACWYSSRDHDVQQTTMAKY